MNPERTLADGAPDARTTDTPEVTLPRYEAAADAFAEDTER